MIPYFLLLLGVLIFLYFQKQKNNKSYVIFLILVLFLGLRNLSVGTDTHSYVNRFSNNSFLIFSEIDEDFEIGYKFIEKFASFLSTEYVSLLLTIGIIVVYFQMLSIRRLSYLPIISFFVLITLGFFTFSFNGARQGIAAAIYMYAIQFLVNKNFKKYLLWVMIAFLFHKTVIITLPLYFIFTKKFSIKYLFLLIVSTLVALINFKQLITIGSVVSDKYKIYTEVEETGGKILTFFYFALSIFFIFFRKFIHKKLLKEYDLYLNMFLIATIVYVLVFFSGTYIELTRLAFYFLLSAVFIWPIIFISIRNQFKLILYLGFILLHLLYFYVYLSKMAGLTPYILNKNIF